jgi:hypothetical protein
MTIEAYPEVSRLIYFAPTRVLTVTRDTDNPSRTHANSLGAQPPSTNISPQWHQWPSNVPTPSEYVEPAWNQGHGASHPGQSWISADARHQYGGGHMPAWQPPQPNAAYLHPPANMTDPQTWNYSSPVDAQNPAPFAQENSRYFPRASEDYPPPRESLNPQTQDETTFTGTSGEHSVNSGTVDVNRRRSTLDKGELLDYHLLLEEAEPLQPTLCQTIKRNPFFLALYGHLINFPGTW